jgi:hypothetical protein
MSPAQGATRGNEPDRANISLRMRVPGDSAAPLAGNRAIGVMSAFSAPFSGMLTIK